MTIQEALNNIKNAVFGRDVRQSIHDGIDTINKESKADMQKKQETINAYTGKMDLLNDKYEEQIKNMTLDSPSDAEIVDARRTSDNIIYSTLKQRLDEDKNSIWIREETICNAVLNEAPGKIGVLEIDISQIIADKDAIRITPVFESQNGTTLTGAAFAKVETGEKLTLTIGGEYYLSLYYDIAQNLGETHGPMLGELTFPVNFNVKVSYPSPTEKKVNEFIGNPDDLGTTSKTNLVAATNECVQRINECFQNASDGKSKLAAVIGNGATASMTWDQLAAKVLRIRIDKPTTATKNSQNYTQMTVQKAFQNVIVAFGECRTTSTHSNAFNANVSGLSITGGDEGGISIPSGSGTVVYTEYLVGGSFTSGTVVQIGYN